MNGQTTNRRGSLSVSSTRYTTVQTTRWHFSGALGGAALGAIGGAIAGNAGKGAAIGGGVGGASGEMQRRQVEREDD